MKKLLHTSMGGSCAVIALHYVSGVDEDTALRICAFHGFTPENGMEDDDWKAAAKELSIHMRAVAIRPMRLRSFLKRYTKGLFLVATFDHLFVVDNGLIVDPLSKRKSVFRVIKNAWLIVKND